MPKLQEYVAPNRDLRPASEGYQAFETAGRRVGGMYREAGGDIAKAAATNAAVLTDKAQWPFTLFALQQKFTAAKGGASVRTQHDSNSLTADQFAPRVMPNLAAENAAADAANGFNNPLSAFLSPAGAHQQSLADQAASLTNNLRDLIGAGDPTGGFTGPMSSGGGFAAPGAWLSPNADAEASANAWGNSIAGQSNTTGVSPGGGVSDAGGGDFGGGSDAGGGGGGASGAPIGAGTGGDIGAGAVEAM